MKNHVLRPLWVVIGIVSLVLLVRHFLVPVDFGIHGRNFTYGFHRLSNITEWQILPAQYQGNASCPDCHDIQSQENQASRHRSIQCENCHGPALDHPGKVKLLPIDRTRELCLRCHAHLPYPNTLRASLKGIDPETHNPGTPCVECHNPHLPDLEGM